MSHHFVSVKSLPLGGERLDQAKTAGLKRLLTLVALAGLVLSALLFVFGGAVKIPSKDFLTGEPIDYTLRAAYSYSWLFAFVAVFTVVLGGLFWVLLHNAWNSHWGVAVRRIPETLSVQFPLVFLLGLPLVVWPEVRETLWQWIHDHALAAQSGHGETVRDALHHSNHLLYVKYHYLSLWGSWPKDWLFIPGWLPRYFLYFIGLGFGAWMLRTYSVSQDNTGLVRPTLSARRFSCGWMVVFALALTFASFDWIKSLNYAWFSTMFGVNFFAGSAQASMGVLILLTIALVNNGYLKRIVTVEHFHIMGKLMHAFTIFWAYIAFSQFFLTWYANIAEETQFYAIRNTDGWNYYSMFFLTVGHFLIPFVLLLPRSSKKNLKRLQLIAIWVVLMHLAEIYWFIIPERGPKLADQPTILWAVLLDVIALATMAAVVGLGFLKTLGSASLYPCGDPRLQDSINVVN